MKIVREKIDEVIQEPFSNSTGNSPLSGSFKLNNLNYESSDKKKIVKKNKKSKRINKIKKLL